MSDGATPRPREAAPVHRHVAKGLLIGFALQLLSVLALSVAMGSAPRGLQFYVPVAIIYGLGVVQLIYIVPAVLYFRKRGQHGIVKGLWIAASIVVLLNASCWGLMLGGAIRIGG